MKLPIIVHELKKMAPLHLADEWDNVGLLINPLKRREITKILMTIDLTEAVADEAIEQETQLILSYHPILFRGIKRLNGDSAYDRAVMKLIQHDIAVYSPHTALDCVSGGVNDWLAALLNPKAVEILQPSDKLPGAGQGRLAHLQEPASLSDLTRQIKTALNLPAVRTAQGTSSRKIETVALCAGAGSEAFRGVRADCFLTGEMSHHHVLAATTNGAHVILCEHTNTERGFLPLFGKQLQQALPEPVEIILSAIDTDPLQIC
jgi:dinuclear metal center YbgI/SA1388 family protein